MGIFNNKKQNDNNDIQLHYMRNKLGILLQEDLAIKEVLDLIYDATGIKIELYSICDKNKVYLGLEFTNSNSSEKIKTDIPEFCAFDDLLGELIIQLTLIDFTNYILKNNNLKEYSDNFTYLLNIKFCVSELSKHENGNDLKIFYRLDYLIDRLALLCSAYHSMFNLDPIQRTDKSFTPYIKSIIRKIAHEEINNFTITPNGFNQILDAYKEFLQFLNKKVDIYINTFKIINDEKEFPKELSNIINALK